MSLRLFAGFDIPDPQATQLNALQKGVPGASWRPREALHVTLRFFGDLDERLAEDLDHELGAIACAPFEVTLKDIGWFGHDAPSSLWVGVEERPALRNLAAACERAARRVRLEPDPRLYTPHVTLAYCRHALPDEAVAFVQRTSPFRAEPFLVDRFFLYSSWLGKGPAAYVEEAEYPLIS